MSHGHLLLRADASATMGTGHVMRSLALAQAWQRRGGSVTLAAVSCPPAFVEVAATFGVDVRMVDATTGSPEDAAKTRDLAVELGAAWVVADGYGFGAVFQGTISQRIPLLVIDDNAENHSYHAQLVLNANPFANAALYADRTPDTGLLLGTRFALLRSEFHGATPDSATVPPVATRLLIVMGGADPARMTRRILAACNQLTDRCLEIVVVIGGANPDSEAIRSQAAQSPHRVQIEVNSRRMAELMRQTDLAVSAASSTCWELFYMGVPTATLSIADNQLGVADVLGRLDVVLPLGRHTEFDEATAAASIAVLLDDAETRQRMRNRCQQLVDGAGADRVVAAMTVPPFSPADAFDAASLRLASIADAYQLWCERNAPDVRSVSLSSDEIPLATHVAWLTRALSRPDCRFWVYEAAGELAGSVRYIRDGVSADVSISVARFYRSRGLAYFLLRQTLARACAELGVDTVRAVVKLENAASLRLFSTANFTARERAVEAGHEVQVFTWKASA